MRRRIGCADVFLTRVNEDGSDAGGGRSVVRLLFDPVFGPFFWSKLCSLTGIWIQNIVGAILVWQISGSAVAVGAVSVAQFVPQMLFAPISGAVADRGDRQRQVVTGRFVCMFGSGMLAAWLMIAGSPEALGVAPVLLSSLVVGVGFMIGGPAMQSLLPDLVRPTELPRAVVLDNVPMTLGRAVGPAVGALIVAQVGFAAAFWVAAVSQAIFGLTVMFLRIPRGRVRHAGSDVSIKLALGLLKTDRVVLYLLLGVAAVGIGGDPVITLTPLLADNWEGSAALVGYFGSAFGIGAIIGFAFVAAVRFWASEAWLAVLGLGALGVGSIMVTIAPSVGVAIASFGLSGAGMTLAMTGCTTMIYQRVPAALRGRIMALWFVGFVGSRPLAATMNGALADFFNVSTALLATAALVLAVAWMCRPRQLRQSSP